MLNATKNRIDYLQILAPPDGYALAKAVATTYTLDLFTLLSIPFSLFFGRAEEPFDIVERLESIQRMENVVDVFCQKGKIKIPADYSSLFAFLEKSVHEIPLAEARSAFHPKVWILRYEHKEKNTIQYRLIVLSRNLTSDRSWDVAFHSDGFVGRKGKQNIELIDFLKDLEAKSGFDIDKSFMEGLKRVKFDLPVGSKELLFYPIIPTRSQYANPLKDQEAKRVLVVSPFLDVSSLKRISKQAPESYLFSRKEELDKIDVLVLRLFDEVFYLNPDIVNGEDALDEDEAQVQNLHAKFYAYDDEKEFKLFLGSANCTKPAFGRNTEFMIGIVSNKKELSVEFLRDELLNEDDEKRRYFLEYDLENPIQSQSNEVIEDTRELEFELQKAFFKGRFKKNEQNTFDLHLYYDLTNCYLDTSYVFFIKPLGFEELQELPKEINSVVFKGIGMRELTSFFEVTVMRNKEKVVSIILKLPIIMPENRLGSVFKSLIDSQEELLRYLKFILADDNSNYGDPLQPLLKAKSSDSKAKQLFYDLPIFEQLLKAVSTDPQKLNSIDRALKRLADTEVVPEELIELWKTFEGFVKK